MSRLLITGSRARLWTPYDSHALLIAVQKILEKTHTLPILVHGGATGADTEAARMGQQLLNLPTEVHRADWTKYGRSSFASALFWVRQPGSALNSVNACAQKTRGCTHEATKRPMILAIH